MTSPVCSSVCMVVHSYCPDDPRVSRQAAALAARGTSVDVVCLRKEGEAAREVVNGVRYFRLPLRRRRGGVVRYIFEYLAFFLMAGAVSSWLALRRHYDVFQAHNMPDLLVFCGLLHRLRGTKLLLDLHDLMPEVFIAKYDLGKKSIPIRLIELQEFVSFAFADLVLTTSTAFYSTLVGRIGSAAKLRIVLNSPDERIFPEPDAPPPTANGTFRLIYNAPLLHRCGPDVAIRALALVRGEIPEARLDFLGTGPSLEECVRLTAELGLGDIVTFHGHLPMERVPEHVLAADVGVISNRLNVFTEKNLPTRVFEYIRMKKVAVVSRTPGIADYFGEDALVWFDPGDEKDLARAIREVHRDPQHALQVLERGARVYDRHRWNLEKEVYFRLVDALAAGEALPE